MYVLEMKLANDSMKLLWRNLVVMSLIFYVVWDEFGFLGEGRRKIRNSAKLSMAWPPWALLKIS